MNKGESKSQVREKLAERRQKHELPKETVVDGSDPRLQDAECSCSSEELILRFFKSAAAAAAPTPTAASPPTVSRASSQQNDSTSSPTPKSPSTPCNSPLGEVRKPNRIIVVRSNPATNDNSKNATPSPSSPPSLSRSKQEPQQPALAHPSTEVSPRPPPPPPEVSPRPPPPPITPRPKTTKTIYSKLPKGKVFGVPLSTLTTNPSTGVPLIVHDLVEALSCHLWTEGLFRIPGTSKAVDELRTALDRQHEHEDEDLIGNIRDPHDLSSLLKLFLRDLPDPLFTFELFQPLINTQSNPDLESRAECIQILLESLEKAHYNVVRFLCKFLKNVAEHKEHNKMSVDNLAMVFAPNVIRPKNEVASTIQIDYKQARETLVDIIVNSKIIFPV